LPTVITSPAQQFQILDCIGLPIVPEIPQFGRIRASISFQFIENRHSQGFFIIEHQDIDGSAFMELKDADLEKIGVTNLIARSKLLQSIDKTML